MIDRSTEQLLTLTELAGRLPSCRSGKKVAVSTVWRWARHGVKGIKLETTHSGGTLFTTMEAYHRLCDAIDRARTGQVACLPATATGERAMEQLKSMGF